MTSTFVTITSQGQITVPARIRRMLSFEENSKLLVGVENEKMTVQRVPGILELEGVFHDRAKKGISIDKIIRLEEDAVAEAVAERLARKEKRSV